MARRALAVHEAVTGADPAALREAIASGADVDARDAGGNTPLILAATLGQDEAARALVAAGADVEAANRDTHTALMEAAWNGREAVVGLLLEAGADPARENHLALDFAVRMGHVAIARRLIAAGADPNRRDEQDGMTPLAEAIQAGDEPMIRLLREAVAASKAPGARLSRRRGRESADGAALVNAAYHGRIALVRELLAEGADVEARFQGNTPIIAAAMQAHADVIRLLIEAGADVDAAGEDGMSALLWAAEEGSDDCVGLLLEAGSRLDGRDQFGNSALQLAIRDGHAAIVTRLVQAGAGLDEPDDQGWTPLRHAAWAEEPEVVRRLLAAGAAVDGAGPDGVTPLIEAARSGQGELVDLLLEAGADPERTLARKAYREVPVGKGGTALMLAAHEGHLAVVERLLRAGVDPDARDARGRTALSIAGRAGHVAVVERLRDAGASGEVDARRLRNLKLRDAVLAGDAEAARHALDAGADPDAAWDAWSTPLVVAARAGHRVLVAELLARGANPDGQSEQTGGPLRQAAIRGHVEVVRDLLAAGAAVDRRYEPCSIPAEEPNTVYPSGEHVLLDAVAWGRGEIAALLLDAGADPNLVDSRGLSALAHAAGSRHYDLARLLIDRGAVVDDSARDYVAALGFPGRAESDEFRRSVREMAARCGAEPRPIDWLPGAVSFRVTAASEAEELLRTKRAVEPIGAGMLALETKTQAILDDLGPALAGRGFLAFDAGYPLGCGDGKFLVLAPTDDKYAVIAAVGTRANEQEIPNPEVRAWLRALDAEHPFRLRACRFDTVGIEFHEPVPDPRAMAERMYAFCNDLVDQNFGSLERLAEHLEGSRRVTFWWD